MRRMFIPKKTAVALAVGNTNEGIGIASATTGSIAQNPNILIDQVPMQPR
jgi:hypothetical protein